MKSRWELSRERRTKAKKKIEENPPSPLVAKNTENFENQELPKIDHSYQTKEKARPAVKPPIPSRADSTDDMIARIRRRLDQSKDQSETPNSPAKLIVTSANLPDPTEFSEKCRIAPEPVKRTGSVTVPSVRIRTKRAESSKPVILPKPEPTEKPERIPEASQKSSKSSSSDEEVKVL